ncbi:HAD family hydrolase [Deinococcus taklimakanensis]|uniref:HAD family hydrolase n=1 Tax=Deinococcus taklimakanensis TaxID=536443 RepID=A0ABW5P1D9_9DEIO
MSFLQALLHRDPPPRELDPATHVLLLDVDGVLLTPPSAFHQQFSATHRPALQAFFNGPFESASTGKSDIREHLPAFLNALGRKESPDEYLRAWCDHENYPNEPLLAEVRRLRTAGWRVYLATNQEAYRVSHMLDVGGLRDVVDGEYASCSVGHRKPGAAYYKEVTRRLGLAPEHIVFWDDTPANVQSARKAGWQAHLYQDVPSFRRKMTCRP